MLEDETGQSIKPRLVSRSASTHGESIIALSKWLETPPGRYVLAWEQVRFDSLVADIFGFNAVQIGVLEMPALRSNRMPFVFAAGEPQTEAVVSAAASSSADDSHAPPARVQAHVHIRLEELPFASQSIDLLVLPHALEFAEDPHRVLREVERVLMPEGQVVISGFNPVSLWGARQMIGRTFNAPFLPREGQFLALPRLKDWLKLLGFEVNRGHFGCYRPPFKAEAWQSRLGFMESAGSRWWPFCGAVYMVHAIKRVQGMRLIGPAWKDRKRAAAALQPSVNRTREACTNLAGRDRDEAVESTHAEV
ncbi:MAG: class I SAM-dependent methyltransferase [Burkholderiaceae bacterium]